MPGTYLAYIDESGSDGPISKGGSLTFTLGCVLVDADRWPEVFDGVISYRRYLKSQFRIPIRAELKANHLIRNGGALRDLKLSERARFSVYRGLLRLQDKLNLKSFAVVIRKQNILSHSINPREVAWEFLIQRLERFTTNLGCGIVVCHDEGEGGVAKKLARKARRAGSAGCACPLG